jgi:hypothetical protein
VGEEEERTLENGHTVMPRECYAGSSNSANANPAVARVKKIIKLDDEVRNCSNAAAFVVAGATVRLLD